MTTSRSGATIATPAKRERLAAIERAALAAVTASKSADAAAAFVADFPSSPRRDEVSHLAAKWAEASAVQAALDAIARGDADAAESLLGSVTDGDRRKEIVASVDALRDQRSWDEAS